MIFDVGANRGQYLDLVFEQFANHPIMVHAFEPSPAAFADLSRRYAGRKQVALNNLALGSAMGEQTLFYESPGSQLSSLYPRRIQHHGIHLAKSELVRVETLDTYCTAHAITQIDLLKLDVEGYEWEVLQGASQLFERKQIAMLSFEFGGCNLDARTFFRDFFHFFTERQMTLARVTPFGTLRTIQRYDEGLEQFRTTCFVASL